MTPKILARKWKKKVISLLINHSIVSYLNFKFFLCATAFLVYAEEDPSFKTMRKKYHETSKEMRKMSLQKEKDELKKEQKAELDYVPGSPKDRVKTISGEVKGLDKIHKLKREKEKKEKKEKSQEKDK